MGPSCQRQSEYSSTVLWLPWGDLGWARHRQDGSGTSLRWADVCPQLSSWVLFRSSVSWTSAPDAAQVPWWGFTTVKQNCSCDASHHLSVRAAECSVSCGFSLRISEWGQTGRWFCLCSQRQAKRLLVKILAIYSAYSLVRSPYLCFDHKVKNHWFKRGYHAYTVNCMFPLSQFQPGSSWHRSVCVTPVTWIFGLVIPIADREVSRLSEWQNGETQLQRLLSFSLDSALVRQSLENGITSPEENAGVINLDNGRAVVRHEQSQGGVRLFPLHSFRVNRAMLQAQQLLLKVKFFKEQQTEQKA